MSKPTDHWLRRLHEAQPGNTRKPAYLLIADLIAEDIRSGRLAARDRLPPLRSLCEDLKLNYTTVARAYAEAQKRGLIDSAAGRGSFVRPVSPAQPLRIASAGAEMTMNMPPEPQDPALLGRLRDGYAALFQHAGETDDAYALLRYQEFGGSSADRQAALDWLQPHLEVSALERVLVGPGIQSTLTTLMGLLARPGETICVESLTYPGVKAIAAHLGIRLQPLALDDEGPDADAFEHHCRTQQIKALYCNPTLLNPTTGTISAARRELLADICLRYSVPIIEDDAYGLLPSDAPPPLASYAPDLTYYVTGLSKHLGAGLRVAYVIAPDARKTQRLAATLRATSVMASPITTALATRWVQDGTALAMLQATRRESAARQELAAQRLSRASWKAHSEGFHVWLELPEPWSGVEFASHLRAMGVGVVASPAFCTDGAPPEAVRICLGGPGTLDDCAHALDLIADTLEHPPSLHAKVM
ncbi:MAG: PLP-dependent aminotransferase family protein [Aquabacterium sp.]|nr:MAG: PLP-dependent aminotransferase family protein [Aquabacterium sp.]